jgi:hypothetical protein
MNRASNTIIQYFMASLVHQSVGECHKNTPSQNNHKLSWIVQTVYVPMHSVLKVCDYYRTYDMNFYLLHLNLHR